jgi:branched-chain amino acid transport system substrate-binding protein
MTGRSVIACTAAGFMLVSCTPLATTPRVVGTVRIAADLPLSGDDAPDGQPVEDAFRLALERAHMVCGASSHADVCVRVQSATYDDVSKGIHDPATGARNVERMAADARIVAMVGPLYDSLARSEIPVANAAGLPILSPTNTDECLTQEPPDGHCHGEAARLRPHGFNNYFRVVTTQLAEGEAAADLATKVLGRQTAYVVDDQTPIGQAVAADFSRRFREQRGRIVTAADLATAKALGADIVYFGGVDVLAAAALRRQMSTVMPGVPLIGSDRLASSQFAVAAGGAVRGSYYTVPGPYPANLRGIASFLRDFRNSSGHDATAGAVAAFDATNLVLRAIARAIDDAGGALPSRRQVLREVAATSNVGGLMGSTSLDSRGDTTLKLVTAYQWLAPTDRVGRFIAQLSLT